MDAGWISSLSIATSINTVSAEDDINSADGSAPRSGSLDGSFSFPPPPPRTRTPSVAAESSQRHFDRNAEQDSISSSNLVTAPTSRFHRQTNSLEERKVTHAQQYFGRDAAHLDRSGDSVQEPFEQLKRSRDDADPGGSDHEIRAAHPSWPSQRANAPTNSSVRVPRPVRHGSTPWQRPHLPSGLPTSYKHHNRPRSQSPTLAFPSKMSPSTAHARLADSTLAPQTWTSKGKGKERSSSTPLLLPSPVLHLNDQDRSWSELLSDFADESSSYTSIASLHTRSRSNSLRGVPSSSGYSHSRHPSLTSSILTRPSSPETGFEPSRSIIPEDAVKSTELGQHHSSSQNLSMGGPFEGFLSGRRSASRGRSNFFPVSQSQPDLSLAPTAATQRVTWESDLAEQGQGTHVRSPMAANTAMVTTELVSGPYYFEPHNMCEAIVMPRPRLRSRSLGTKPSIVVERVHAAPERIWHRNVEGNNVGLVQVAPRSQISQSSDRNGVRPQPLKDARLMLHTDIAPPLPPKDSPGPPSALLPSKPLPPLPIPQVSSAPMKIQNGHDSFDSADHMDTQELLQRNQEIEQDRRAWRQESSTSLVPDINAFRDRLSPCLRDPSPRPSQHQGPPLSAGPHETDPSPIRIHRVWNKDGTEHTFLVVHSRRGHPYGNHRMSVSSPDLGDANSAALGRTTAFKHFAQRLGNLKSGRRRRPSATRPDRGSSTPHQEAQKMSQLTPGSGRSFGKERRLVSEETVVIGKPFESANQAGLLAARALTKDGSPAISQESESVEQATIHIARHESLTRSRYRTAGTRDEIKAQLGETPSCSIARQLSLSSRSPGEDNEGEVKWIDPGSNTIMQGKLILPDNLRARQQPGEEAMGPDRREQLAPSPWSNRTSGSESYRSCQSDDHPDHSSAPPWGMPRPMMVDSDICPDDEGFVRASSFSVDAQDDFVLWDANNVDLNDLFFRPPQ